MYDAILDLLAPTSMTGSPAAGTAKLLGRNRSFRAWGRCGGDATVGATATFTFEESTTGTGSWTDVAGAPSLVVTEQLQIDGTTIRPEVPSTVYPTPSVIFTTSKDYVRYKTPVLGGTTPTLPGVSIKLEPLEAGDRSEWEVTVPDEDEAQPVPAQPAQPKPRFGYDENGEPIEAPATGLAMDPETGQAVIPPEEAPAPPARSAREAPEKPPEKPAAR